MTITADTFADAAVQLCIGATEVGVDSAIGLHRASGPVAIIIDNDRSATDDVRQWMVTEDAWQTNPMMVQLRRQLGVVGPEAFEGAHTDLVSAKGYLYAGTKHIGIPMIGSDGWFGSIAYALHVPPSAALERQLAILTTELTVWCTARGISTLPDVRPLAPRQHEVATLAADGRTNPEIADTLGISINTVKLRLKQAFERLGVDNRTELANVLRRLAPLDGISPGITRRATVTITRGVPDRVLDTEL